MSKLPVNRHLALNVIEGTVISLFLGPLSKVRVVLLADAPLDRLFVHTGGDDERDRQLLDDLGLSEVWSHLCYLSC